MPLQRETGTNLGRSLPLRRQHEAWAEKAATAIEMKLQLTEKDLIIVSKTFLTSCQALDEFEMLTSKKDKLECVKEQGWEEAHHPWSKNKHQYTAS